MKLTDNEKRDIVNLIEQGKNLPEKYRFLLFDESKQVELTWNGKSDEITNVELPFQIIEQVDEPRTEDIKMLQSSFDFATGQQITGWTNKLIWGDNKYILSSLKNGPMREEIEKQGGIKLIYIDPPFDVGADFSMEVDIGNSSYEKKPNVLEQIAYRDTWGQGEDSFISMIFERLILMKDILSEDGLLFVHCDSRVNSLIRLALDEIFNKENFINEIVWKRIFGAGKSSQFAQRKFGSNTDTIYVYAKSKSYSIKPLKELSESEIVKKFNKIDTNGERFYDDTSHLYRAMGLGARPNLCYEWRGFNNKTPAGWTMKKEKLEEEYQKGNIAIIDGKIQRRKYLRDFKG